MLNPKLNIGEGHSKIVVSLLGENLEKLSRQIKDILSSHRYVDIVELRADYFSDETLANLEQFLTTLQEELKGIPILFTYRTKGQGGHGDYSSDEYFELLHRAIQHPAIELVDIEMLMYDDIVKPLMDLSRSEAVGVVLSYHNFEYTPKFKELMAIYTSMQEMGGDILKVAVMPETGHDVLVLLQAVFEAKQQVSQYIVGISMSELGKISRIAGGVFGSCITFGAITESAAPGQLHVDILKNQLEMYEGSQHES